MKHKLFTLLAIIAIAAHSSSQTFAQNKNGKTGRENNSAVDIAGPSDPYTLRTYPQVTVNGVTYKTDITGINIKMAHGRDTDVSFTIIPSNIDHLLYGFSVYGYGDGMPTYGIIANEGSGGAQGNQTIHLHFNSKYLPANGKKSKNYAGYLPVHIYVGSETGRDSNFIKLPISVAVYP